LLYPLASPRPFGQGVTDLAAVDADVFQVPAAKIAHRDKVRLTLTMSDEGGNPTVDETAEARQSNSCSSPDSWRSVVWDSVEHRHGFSFRKGLTLRALSPFSMSSPCTMRRTETFRELRFILHMRLICA
jgi:hypothetical protein